MNLIRLLLVEDEASTVELLGEAIKDADQDYDLKVYSDGESALKFLRSGYVLPQLILLDLNLPGRSGLEILQEVKADPRLRVIPVVVLTSSKSPDDVLKAYANHCNAYIRKPLGFDALIDAIEAMGKFWFEIATVPDHDGEAVSSSIRPPLK